jgi:hypothetical protein
MTLILLSSAALALAIVRLATGLFQARSRRQTIRARLTDFVG